jgi:site-specific recombinase XerD
MKIDGCGQAKVLSLEERSILLSKGFLCQRDRTLNELCYYLACRSSEARQLLYTDVFNIDDSVKDVIVIRKEITKGKQATRSIPTHSKLKESLEKYIRDSRELLEIKNTVGDWDHQSFSRANNISANGKLICPKCSSDILTTAGYTRGKRVCKCKSCSYRFQQKTAFLEHPHLVEAVIRLGVYNSYCYGFLYANPNNPFLFPGFSGQGCLSRSTAKEIFVNACKRVEIVGAATHSWRRTALTEMSRVGIPLRVIQKISGHQRLNNLQKYLEVSKEQIEDAVRKLPSFN